MHTGCGSVALLKIVDAPLEALDFLSTLDLFDLVNLLEKHFNLFDHQKRELDLRVLVDDFDEVDDILVLRLRNVIVNLEELLDILELGVIFNELFENLLVLLVTDLNEVLGFQNRHYLRDEVTVKDLVNDLAHGLREVWVGRVEAQSVVHDIGKEHL
jgi:hypothetical protein